MALVKWYERYSRSSRSRGMSSMEQRPGRGPSRSGSGSGPYGHRGSRGGQSREHDSYQARNTASPRYQSPSGVAAISGGGGGSGSGQSTISSRLFGNSHAEALNEERRRPGYGAQKQVRSESSSMSRRGQQQHGSSRGGGSFKDGGTELKKFGQEYRLADGSGKGPSVVGLPPTSGGQQPLPAASQRLMSAQRQTVGKASCRNNEIGSNGSQKAYVIGKEASPPRSGRVGRQQYEYKRSTKSVPPVQSADAALESGRAETTENNIQSTCEQPATEKQAADLPSIKATPLNPDAEEFRPQSLMSTAYAHQQQQQQHQQQQQQQQVVASPLQQPQIFRQITAYYPMSMPNMSTPQPPSAGSGGGGGGGGSLLMNQAGGGAAQGVYSTPGNNFSVQVFPGNPPFYNIQSSQAPVAIIQGSSNQHVRRTRKPTPSGGQPAPPPQQPSQQIMQGAQQPVIPAQPPPYFVQYAAPMSATGQGAVGANPFLFGATRLLPPQYVVQPPSDGMSQSIYALPQLVQVAAPFPGSGPPLPQVLTSTAGGGHMPASYETVANANNTVAQSVNGGQGAAIVPSGTYPVTMPNQQQVVLVPGSAYFTAAPGPLYHNPNMVNAAQASGAAGAPQPVAQAAHAGGLIQVNPTGQGPTTIYSAGQSYAPETGFIQYASGGQLAPNTAFQGMLRSNSVPSQYVHPVQQSGGVGGGTNPPVTIPNN